MSIRFTRSQALFLLPLFLIAATSTAALMAAPPAKPDIPGLYRAARYIDTASGFEIRTATETGRRMTDYNHLAIANALSILGDYTNALGVYESFACRYPGSDWFRNAQHQAAVLYAAKSQWLDCAGAWARYLSSLLPEISHDLQDPRARSALNEIINALVRAGVPMTSASLPAYILEHYPDTSLAHVYQLQMARDSWQNNQTETAIDYLLQYLNYNRLPPAVLRARLGMADEIESATITREQWGTALAQIPDSTHFQRVFLTRTDIGSFDKFPVYGCIYRPISVDGNREDWAGITVLDLDRDLYVFRGRRESFEDFSAYFQSAWNEEYLFILLLVLDDKHSQRNTVDKIYEGDSLEIACHSTFAQTDSVGRIVPDMELYYSIHNDGRVFGPGGEYPLKNQKDGQCVIRKSKGKCIYEIAIPWSKINRSPVQPGFRIWFNITVNDSDGDNRKCTIKWTPRNPENVPAAYGTIELR